MVDVFDRYYVQKQEVLSSKKGGREMTEMGKVVVVVPDGIKLWELYQNYKRERRGLARALTSPRKQFNDWERKCRARRLEQLDERLLPPLQMIFAGI